MTSSWWWFAALFLVVPSYQWPLLDSWFAPSKQPPDMLGNANNSREAKVLNFFPIPVEEECLSEDKRRKGICMNTYQCRIQQGKSHGPCALGFGVCCIFTTSCGGEVQNNLTYVISPGFPNLIDQPMNCSVTVKKVETQVSQLRIDFIHFNIGQPNRSSGVCDQDLMEVRTGNRSFRLCGWNSGQHIYLDATDDQTTIDFRLPSALQSRMWEMRVSQLGFEQRAPAGCLQYFEDASGTLRTLNYLPNGRLLAEQDHLLCVRQSRGMCSISYAQCSPESFRIGPRRFGVAEEIIGDQQDTIDEGEGSGTGPLMTNASDGSLTGSRCRDRVLIPCDFEEFITPGNDGAGFCNLEHCGHSLCKPEELDADGDCRVETSATPFHIRVAFGPGQESGAAPDDNIGMCLRYEQLPCTL